MSLKDKIASRIAHQGPISIADYMEACLLDPEHGYYTTRVPFGAEGDFTTAPEISQMFGEMIGLCLAQAWIDQGQPARFTLAELGPGRGTLIADVLRATRQFQGFHEAADIVLVEASPRLKAEQSRTLKAYSPRFLDTVDDLDAAPLFFVANEFFDALPIRQFQRDGNGWRERQVGIKDSELTLGLGPKLPQPALDPRMPDTSDGDIVEYAPALAPIVSALGHMISEHGGAGLVIDYGDWRSLGDTLQAVQKQKPIDILSAPGMSDLTAHVDFEALARAAGCRYCRLTPQGVFLERLGITARAQALAEKLSGTALETHILAHRRLTHPGEMGNLFKVIGLYPDGAPPPAGLEI